MASQSDRSSMKGTPGRAPRALQGKLRHFLAIAPALLLGSALPATASSQATDPKAPASSSQTTAPSGGTAAGYKKLSLAELMDIEVTSVSKRPEKLSESPSAIQVISSEDVRRSGASSLPESLRLASNLQVAQRNSHDWAISARGFNTELANKLLVLIDGRTVYTPLFSGVFWDVQDTLLEDLDRIEVISGPGGALWGANAVNGVINISTKSAQDTQGLFAEAGGGSWQRGFGSARYGGKLGDGAFVRAYGKYFDRGTQRLPTGGEAIDSWHMGRGGFRLDTDRASKNRFTLQGDYYKGTEDIPGATRGRVRGDNVLGRWSRVLSESSDFTLQAYFDETHLELPKAAFAMVPAGTLVDDLRTYDLDLQHRLGLGTRHRLVWGLGYRRTQDRVKNAPSLVLLPEALDHNLFSGFIQDEILLRENVFATLGSKIEHNGYTGVEVEPSARVQWNASPRQTLWAALSRAVRTPSRIDRDLRQPTGFPAPLPSSVLNGNPAFKSEGVVAYEAGYRIQATRGFAGSASLFYNNYKDLRSTTPGPPGFPTLGFPLVFWNNLEGETYGVELSGSYQPVTTLRLRAGYTLLKEDIRIKPGEVDFSRALNETSDPEHQFSLRSSLDVTSKMFLDVGFRFVGRLTTHNGLTPGFVPHYSDVDARLAWQPTSRLGFSLVAQNLLAPHHPEYGFPGPSRLEVRRSAYGAVSVRW